MRADASVFRVVVPRGACAASLFDVLSQSAHGVLCNVDAFAERNRGPCGVYSGKNFVATALPLDPQRQRRLNCVLGAGKPSALDGLPDEILLLRGEIYLHAANVRGLGGPIKNGLDHGAEAGSRIARAERPPSGLRARVERPGHPEADIAARVGFLPAARGGAETPRIVEP